MKVQAYIYHKRAEKYSDCQDYFGIDFQNNRIAVSDGMSQSIYPQWWAEILVNAYLAKGTIPGSPEELQTYQYVWQEKVRAEIDKREAAGINPWRLKNAFAEKSGAGATLCGFAWNANSWNCECIGDSSLIVINKDYTINILSSQEGEFGNHPDYLDSFRNGRGSVKSFEGSFKDVIAILLVTDPFSELLHKHLNDKNFIETRLEEFLALSDHPSYCELVEHWRDALDMHNDDSTLIILSDFSTDKNLHEHIDSLNDLCIEEMKVIDESNTAETSNIKKQNVESCNGSNKGCCIECSQPIKFQDPLSEEEAEVTKEFLHACKKMLNSYYGKRSKTKVSKYINNLLHTIIAEFCKK